MSDQESVWYYTQHGERKGPVTLEVLRGALLHQKIDSNKDLIWGPGLQDWVKSDQVPQLQDMPSGPPAIEAEGTHVPAVVSTVDSSTIEKAPKPTAATNPYQSPKASDEDDSALADAMAARRGNTYKGMGRLMYWVAPSAIYLIVFVALAAVGAAIMEDSEGPMAIVAMIALFVAFILCFLATLSRLKNLAMSRWSFLWSFVPFANIWLGYRLYVCPPGYQDHKKLDTAGKVMVVLYSLVLIGSISFSAIAGVKSYEVGKERTQQKVDALELRESDLETAE